MVYICCVSNLNWTGDLLCITDLLRGISSTGSLEDYQLGAVSLGSEAIDIKSFGGEYLATGSIMGVGDVFGLCIGYFSPGS